MNHLYLNVRRLGSTRGRTIFNALNLYRLPCVDFLSLTQNPNCVRFYCLVFLKDFEGMKNNPKKKKNWIKLSHPLLFLKKFHLEFYYIQLFFLQILFQSRESLTITVFLLIVKSRKEEPIKHCPSKENNFWFQTFGFERDRA